MGKLGDSLGQAVAKAFTRPAPKSAQAQMKYLVKQLKEPRPQPKPWASPSAPRSGTSPANSSSPAKELAARLAGEVRKRWQPQIRAKAKKAAATSGGLIIETRVRFGYTAAAGTTDDGRMRHLTQGLPPTYAARLFEAQEQGATEQQLLDIVAEGFQEIYFKDRGRRVSGLLVEFTDVDHIDVQL